MSNIANLISDKDFNNLIKGELFADENELIYIFHKFYLDKNYILADYDDILKIYPILKNIKIHIDIYENNTKENLVNSFDIYLKDLNKNYFKITLDTLIQDHYIEIFYFFNDELKKESKKDFSIFESLYNLPKMDYKIFKFEENLISKDYFYDLIKLKNSIIFINQPYKVIKTLCNQLNINGYLIWKVLKCLDYQIKDFVKLAEINILKKIKDTNFFVFYYDKENDKYIYKTELNFLIKYLYDIKNILNKWNLISETNDYNKKTIIFYQKFFNAEYDYINPKNNNYFYIINPRLLSILK